MTCFSCRHSIGHATPQGAELWCQLRDSKALKQCESYEYECGTDEQERKLALKAANSESTD
jgi:hypothetical protein